MQVSPTRVPRAELERIWAGYVSRIAAADQEALAALYDASNRLVYGIALRILDNPADAEEVTLDLYAHVWRHASAFDPQRGTVVAWLITMARSRGIDRLRAGAFRVRTESRLDLATGAAPDVPFTFGVEREVRAAIESLSPQQREAIELVYWYGYTHAELAERLGQPLGTVKSRIRTGMIRLRTHLGAFHDGAPHREG